ncbi:MAG TPA: hypothetical protein VGF24_17030 [Vicinamibacterales bacterium]|jgi:hypothetical protein
MTTTSRVCLTFGELADYWTPDVGDAEIARIELHVFDCADCAARLAESERLRRRLGDTVRAGAFQAIITDAVLNKLSRDGVRVRSYVVASGEAVQCAVWDDDDLLVARLRGDFAGVCSVSAVMRLETGEELDRVSDVPVRDGATELLLALSAEGVRRGPEAPLHLTLTRESGDEIVGEYVFDHRTLTRSRRS